MWLLHEASDQRISDGIGLAWSGVRAPIHALQPPSRCLYLTKLNGYLKRLARQLHANWRVSALQSLQRIESLVQFNQIRFIPS